MLLDEEVVLECPKCHRHGLVRCLNSSTDLFQCVYCDYQHQLNREKGEASASVRDFLIAALTVFAIITLILFPA